MGNNGSSFEIIKKIFLDFFYVWKFNGGKNSKKINNILFGYIFSSIASIASYFGAILFILIIISVSSDNSNGSAGEGNYTGNGTFILPIEEPFTITQEYGASNIAAGSNSHDGIDYQWTLDPDSPEKKGGDLYAVADGEVVEVMDTCDPWGGSLGSDIMSACIITIKHDIDGEVVHSHYGHLSEVFVKVGDQVKQGDNIGVEGNSGMTSGRHLHFSAKDENMKSIDPNQFFDGTTEGGTASTDHQKLMKEAGISESDFDSVEFIINKESSWDHLADNPTSDAYGLCQALPGSKMASAGADWATNPVTQLKWCDSYAKERYGNWNAAKEFWVANNWW